MRNFISVICTAALLLSGCDRLPPKPYQVSKGHISAKQGEPAAAIPGLVEQTTPPLPKPKAPAKVEKYTVVVNEVPVKELLFALARDAKLNVDVDPSIKGVVTMNAVDQTLDQLLDRIARQVDLRYELHDNNLFISPDKPFFRNYTINYLNMSRDTNSSISISTQIASASGGGAAGGGGGGGGGGAGGGGGGGSNSTTDVKSVAVNHFWTNLVKNVQAVLGENTSGGGASGEIPISANVIPHPETGVLTVRATARQQEEIQKLLDQVLDSAERQVMIQATIVEVTLNDAYQAGIDWSYMAKSGKAGFSFNSSTLAGAALSSNPLTAFLLTYTDPNKAGRDTISATLQLLQKFGTVSVLSSPQIMALNNQTAILKVVDNIVYFTVESQQTNVVNSGTQTSVQTTPHTVPVGIVMAVTPQINKNDSVILDVRPTISRVADFKTDPNPLLTTPNQIPEIRAREMESVLRINNGQTAVLGGLMQDTTNNTNSEIPGLARVPFLGEAFKTRAREYGKTELVIFLRPVIVRNPSVEADLRMYKPYLKLGR